MGIPVIDIADARSADLARRHAVARQIDTAGRDTGLFIVVGHGIDPRLTHLIDALNQVFFGLPPDEKARCFVADGVQTVRGYRAVGAETASRPLGAITPPDRRETFRIGRVDTPDDDYHRLHRNRYFAPNVWPERPPAFRVGWEIYYREMEALSARLLRLFALALDVPEEYFDDKIDRHASHLQAGLYPPAPDGLHAEAYPDHGTLTVLLPDKRSGGLQVRGEDEVWIDIAAARESFVVNIGELMAYWTNDRWRSAMHRVVNPPSGAQGASARLALAFFHHPNHDARIECLPSCVDATHPVKYPPTTSGLLTKIARA